MYDPTIRRRSLLIGSRRAGKVRKTAFFHSDLKRCSCVDKHKALTYIGYKEIVVLAETFLKFLLVNLESTWKIGKRLKFYLDLGEEEALRWLEYC